MRVSKRMQHLSSKLRGIKMGVAAFCVVALPNALAAQTTYHDPKGRFDLQVPAGWQLTPDGVVDQVIVHKVTVQAVVMVMDQNKSNAMTAKEFVDATAGELQGRCPTFKTRQSGTVTLAGAQGIFSLFTCSDPKSPSVAETSAALTETPVLIGITLMAPLADYYENLPALDAIRDSLHIHGEKAGASASDASESLAMTELKKACAVGAFTQEGCSRRMGILLGQEETPAEAASTPAFGTVYRDPTGRFSLQVPKGWSATSEGDNGILGVQLRSGANYINVMPAEPAASASEVVLTHEQKMAARSNSTRKPPFGILGLIQIFGNGLEVTYDHFDASSPDGNAIDCYIGGVGDIKGTEHAYLLINSSVAAQQKEATGGLFLSVAQSIHLAGH